MKKTYKVTLSDVRSFETFSNLKDAVKYARACKDDHGGACVYRLTAGTFTGDALYAWSKGADGKVRRVNVD